MDRRSTEGVRSSCLRLADDTFVHIADVTAAPNPLVELATFTAFSSTVASRCLPGHEPKPVSAAVVGDHRLFR